ncbi:ribosome maturation factor RimM [Cellulomonas fimi]|uniref:Ribosome maturation factor RimM n=1 Tax=Cellulomonas fimi (strain ATCC 484 / DSM 20113 / JCM 1341 / CCUG 24087 / LMG 16345 / NBRC 15513 / NCIMB 8980 / NCTC 7547 / NRS-133) TaxID=590998 RepID=F4H6K5_CELFA|nr:ribosome maturation factor RimM [Cellulomonas fimi]AEE45638.1 16S rRNA processing protein RimM [Cellulomonas fimi ATCC 484]NNH08068.1 ribosome maturation factor RimM [Cellulomonas fimi]VEH30144.1 Ribosome maturation factor rimM [Cellulomonas fimi]
MLLNVARIGRAHGLRGEVALDLRTDAPQERLAVGAVLQTEPAGSGPLTVMRTRVQQGRWYVTFAEASDRTAAEALTGTTLVVEVDEDADADDDAWYPHELAGLRAEHVDGRVLGEVVGLEHAPAHDVLVVREPDGTRTLVPFVRAIVPTVDVRGGRVVLDPPGGLLASDAENLVVSDETRGTEA